MPRRATSQDVADLAGVSRSAVSLVLNGHGAGNIAPDKQAVIIEAARTLNYTPNAVALSLRSRRSSTIGVVTDAIATTACGGQLLWGASDAALGAGYLLLVIDTQNDPQRESQAYETLQNRQVDGFLFAAMSLRAYDAPPALHGASSALANCYVADDCLPAYLADEVAGSRSVTRHLIERGHRDIVMLTGTGEVVASSLREQGFSEAMAAAGLPAAAPVTAGWEIDKGYAGAMHVLTASERPTAIVCANDRSAVGVMLAAAQLGLSVPGDLSVVGYDDDENVAPYLVPALTTVRLPHREMGERAMRSVLAGVLDDRPAGLAVEPSRVPRTLLDCPLVVRDSVAPPR
ncbi:MAG TPA: LacI family DNA-binding transcriptional regulator [Microlunatus sp.]